MCGVLSLPDTTADPAVHLLSGLLPAEALIHKRTFTLFGNITRLADTSIENQVAKRKLEVKTFKSHSWFVAVKNILIKYGVPSAESLLETPPGKLKWKKLYNGCQSFRTQVISYPVTTISYPGHFVPILVISYLGQLGTK